MDKLAQKIIDNWSVWLASNATSFDKQVQDQKRTIDARDSAVSKVAEFDEGIDWLELIRDDLTVKFGRANISCVSSVRGSPYGSILGFQTTESGKAFLGLNSCNDTEHPVYFILYLDRGDNLRGYVPNVGNVYNKLANTAFGLHPSWRADYKNRDADGKFEKITLNEGISDPEAMLFQYGQRLEHHEKLSSVVGITGILKDVAAKLDA